MTDNYIKLSFRGTRFQVKKRVFTYGVLKNTCIDKIMKNKDNLMDDEYIYVDRNPQFFNYFLDMASDGEDAIFFNEWKTNVNIKQLLNVLPTRDMRMMWLIMNHFEMNELKWTLFCITAKIQNTDLYKPLKIITKQLKNVEKILEPLKEDTVDHVVIKVEDKKKEETINDTIEIENDEIKKEEQSDEVKPVLEKLIVIPESSDFMKIVKLFVPKIPKPDNGVFELSPEDFMIFHNKLKTFGLEEEPFIVNHK